MPTIAFHVRGRNASELPPRLDPHRLAVRHGHFYAKRAVDALGLGSRGGVVRVSMAHYNTPSEVDRLLEQLDAIV